MQEEGLIDEDDEPTDEELRRFDQGRKNKKVSNEEWVSSTDPESRITKMKDGRTHLAYKAEHVIDLETEAVLAAEIYTADMGDTDTLVDSVMEAEVHLKEADIDVKIEEAVADKGYHSAYTLELAKSVQIRTYIPEPKRQGKLRWTDKPPEYKRTVFTRTDVASRGARTNASRDNAARKVERSFAHVCETGGARRTWLRSQERAGRRYLMSGSLAILGWCCANYSASGQLEAYRGKRPVFVLPYFHYVVAGGLHECSGAGS